MDKLLDEADKVMKKGVPGYVGATRMICKSYWDFKSVMVFDSVSALEGESSSFAHSTRGRHAGSLLSLPRFSWLLTHPPFPFLRQCTGYMESEVKEKEIMPILEKAKAFAVDEDIKLQNFVYDQLS